MQIAAVSQLQNQNATGAISGRPLVEEKNYGVKNIERKNEP
jgi:hypothetical protein